MVGSITLSLTAHNFALALHVIQFLLYRHRRGKNTTLFWVWLREKNSPSHPLFRRLCNLSFLIIHVPRIQVIMLAKKLNR